MLKAKIIKTRTPKINWVGAKSLVINGLSPTAAMRLSGSTAKHPSRVFHNKLSKDEAFRNEMIEQIEEKMRLIVSGIKPHHIKSSSVAGLATALGVLLDKYRLLKGESTSNIALRGTLRVSQMTKEEIIRASKELLELP